MDQTGLLKPIMISVLGIFLSISMTAQSFEGQGRPILDFRDEFHRDFYPISVSGLDTCTSAFGLEKVCIDIQHSRSSDLKIELMAPNGLSIWLSNRNGGEYGSNYINTCFEQNGFNGHIFEGQAPFGGSYIPDGRLGILNENVNPNGTWFLIIRDLAEGEVGQLKSWSLHFGNNPALATESFCDESNPVPCHCPNGEENCELLPDLIVSYKISNNHKGFYSIEHSRYGNQIRLAAALANVGDGPLEFLGTKTWICGDDTVSGSQPCENGEYSRRLVEQKIYVKNDSSFEYLYEPAGTIYFSDEPGHDHFHADDWVEFKLLKKVWYSNNPENYRVIEVGDKISYCLFDSGNCTEDNQFCQDENGGFYGSLTLPNYGFGTFNSCDSDRQGISVGGLDYYGLDFEGQFIQLNEPLKPGTYYVLITVDPTNKFREKNEDNNSILVPIIIE